MMQAAGDWTLHPWCHNNVGGVTAGQARHNSSNVGGFTDGQVGHISSNNNKSIYIYSAMSSGDPVQRCCYKAN